MTVSPAGSGVVEAANFGRTNVKYYPPSTTETCFGINETLDLKATPNSGYKFSRWSISGGSVYNGTANPYALKLPSSITISTTVVAYFTGGSTPPPTPTLVADAGQGQTVEEGVLVALNGSGSSVSSGTITGYLWKQISGETVTLSGATTASPSFTAPDVQEGGATLVFELTVTSDENDTDTDTVSIIIQWKKTNSLIADAGLDQSVQAGDTVTLDGSASTDLEGKIIDYEWKVARGSILTSDIVLSNPEGETTDFTAPDAKGWVEFRLTVTNTSGDKASDTIMVLINKIVTESEFEAHAGPDQVVASGSTVQLSGSATLPVGAVIAGYEWSELSGRTVTLSGSEPMSPGITNEINPTFKAPELSEGQETFTFQLRVQTTSGKTEVDEMLVTVSSDAYINGNAAPNADAGDSLTVIPGTVAILDASNSSDPEGKPLLYHWTDSSGSEIVLSDNYAAKPTFLVPLESGSVTFKLEVTDDAAKKDTDTVEISWQNEPPLAEAGSDQEVFEGDSVTLVGSGSSDPDDLIASYQWEQLSGPDVNILDTTSPDATFVAPMVNGDPVIVTFELTVTDHSGQTSTDQVMVTVKNKNAAPVADAGSDQQVNETSSVVLRGFGSDLDGDTLSYHWVQDQRTGSGFIAGKFFGFGKRELYRADCQRKLYTGPCTF